MRFSGIGEVEALSTRVLPSIVRLRARLVDHRRRVRIKYSNLKKHTLPVDIMSCPWSHVNGIPSYEEGCNTFGERSEPVTNYAELRSCMQESPCKITGAVLLLRHPFRAIDNGDSRAALGCRSCYATPPEPGARHGVTTRTGLKSLGGRQRLG